jgi:hypothetical protein
LSIDLIKPILVLLDIYKISDQLQVISNEGSIQNGTIMNIQLIKSQGYYAPLTQSGKLVVDGIVVSNYATVTNH